MSNWGKNNLPVHVDDHGLIFNALIYAAVFWTVFLVTFMKPHRLYKNLISFLLNMKFKWRGSNWKIYHVLIFIILFFGLLLSCKYPNSLKNIQLEYNLLKKFF